MIAKIYKLSTKRWFDRDFSSLNALSGDLRTSKKHQKKGDISLTNFRCRHNQPLPRLLPARAKTQAKQKRLKDYCTDRACVN